MRGHKVKIISALILAGVLSFTVTGVVQSAVSSAKDPGETAVTVLRELARLGAYMVLPSDGIELPRQDGQAVPGVSSESLPEQENESVEESVDSRHEVQSDPDIGEQTQVSVDSQPQSHSLLVSKNITAVYQNSGDYSAQSGEIKEMTYGRAEDETAVDLQYGQIRNLTSLTSDEVKKAAGASPVFSSEKGEPQVLIIHTHTTESYELNYDDGHYDSSYNGRTLDPNFSVVGTGAAMAQALADSGIGVIHDGTLFDEPLYSGAYSRSAERIKELLEEYPTIEVIIDLHRDGIDDGNARIAPVAEIDGEKTAQAMIICGADDGSGNLPDYLENLGFAAALQQSAQRLYPNLMRPLLFDYRDYNQALGKYNVLIEAGAFGNSPEQAKRCGTLLGKALAELISGQSG